MLKTEKKMHFLNIKELVSFSTEKYWRNRKISSSWKHVVNWIKDLITKNRRAISSQACFSTETKVNAVEFDAAGAYGGIINGRLKPGEEPHKG